MRVSRVNRNFLRVGAALAALLYVTLLSFAALPDLHEKLHPDARHTSHHCVISLVTGGQIEPSGCATLSPALPVFGAVASEVALSDLFSSFELFPPGRAPPVFS
jgi:hypothetical protein